MSERGSSSDSTRGHEWGSLQQKVRVRFEVLGKIGSGAYGHVWKVRCRASRELLAIKKVFLAFQNETDAQRVYREIGLLSKLRHDNVVRLREVITADSRADIYLVFEYLESDVFKAVKNRVLDQTHKKYIVYQLACALKYLHSAGLLHRDLKPSNVLITPQCQVKLCDFGLSRTLNSHFFERPVLTEFIATRWYRAPEVLLGSRCYTTKSDMWSLGCLIYELYSRRTLLPGETTIDQITKILEFKGKPTFQEVQSFKAAKAEEILSFFQVERQNQEYYYGDLECQEVREVLERLFQYDPDNRWSAQQLLDCEFLKEFKGTLNEREANQHITLELNDNRKYKVERYRSEILNLIDRNGQPATKTPSKRLLLSYRTANCSLHSLTNKLKTELNTTLRDKFKNAKYQSAHVSPTRKEMHEKSTLCKERLARVSAHLAQSLHKRSATNEVKSREKSRMQLERKDKREEKKEDKREEKKEDKREEKTSKGCFKRSREGSSLHKPSILKPSASQAKGEKGKQNYECKLKQLKKEKLNHYRRQ